MRARILVILFFIFLTILTASQEMQITKLEIQEVILSIPEKTIKFGALTEDKITYNKKVGLERSTQVDFEQPIISDYLINKYLNKLAQEIRTSTNSEFDFKVKVINHNDLINAFTFPAGYCYIYRGLIETTVNEDELFGMLAHEWGHAISGDDPENDSLVKDLEIPADQISLKILRHKHRNTHATLVLLNRINIIANINIGGTNPKPNLEARIKSINHLVRDTTPKLNLLPEYEYWKMRSRLASLKAEKRFVSPPSYSTMDLNDHPDILVNSILKKNKKRLSQKRYSQ